jgi:hypothetical protein
MFGCKGHHPEGARPVRIDDRGAADAVLSHQRRQPRDERRQLLGRRVRTCEQRVLQHAPWRRIDDDRDAFDRRGRRVRFEIEQDERPERPDVAQRRRQLQRAGVGIACHNIQRRDRRARRALYEIFSAVSALNVVGGDEIEPHVQRRGAAVAALEARGQRLEEAREHERQRLEPLDRPFQLGRRLEALLGKRGHERTDVLAAGHGLPDQRVLSETGGQLGRR